MTKSTLLLAATLAANGALAWVIFGSAGSTATPATAAADRKATAGTRPESAPGSPAAGAGTAASRPAGSAAAATAGADLNISPQEWEALAQGDLKEAVARFRAAGVPENVLPMLVSRLVQDRLRDRMAAISGAGQETPPFWSVKAGNSSINNPERMIAQQALSREMNNLMKDALGGNLARMMLSPDVIDARRRQYGDLPVEKLTQILETNDRISERQQDIYNRNMFGPMLAEDREKIAQIEKERRAAIAAILTPEELEQFDLRSSPSANTVRNQLVAFAPTEEEFKTIYRLQKAFDDQYGQPTTPQQAQEISQRRTELQAEIAAALSPERAEDYKLATQGSSSMLARVVDRLGLPQRTTLEVLAVQKDLQARITSARSASRGQPSEALTALSGEAASRLTALLGEEGFEAYKSYGGGWVQSIVPPPRPAVPPAAVAR